MENHGIPICPCAFGFFIQLIKLIDFLLIKIEQIRMMKKLINSVSNVQLVFLI